MAQVFEQKARLADYLVARCAVEPFLAETIYSLPPQTKRLIDGAKGLDLVPRVTEVLEGAVGFTIQDLMTATGMIYKEVYNWIKPAIEMGAITTAEEGRGRRAAKYRLSDVKLQPMVLPRLEEIAEQYGKREQVYNPFTGESWTV